MTTMITKTFPTIVHRIIMMQKKAPSKRNANSPFETVLRLGMKISSFGNSVDVGFGPKNEGEANGLLLDGCRCCGIC